jgi:hypothetical protein
VKEEDENKMKKKACKEEETFPLMGGVLV